MQLNLPEQAYLLALDDEKGTLLCGESQLAYGLILASIFELVLQGKLHLDDHYLKPSNQSAHEHPVLNAILHPVQEKEEARKIEYWRSYFTNHFTTIYRPLRQRLIEEGIIRIKKRTVFWVFETKTYPAINNIPENRCKSQLRAVINGETTPDDRDKILLALVRSIGLIPIIAQDREQQKQAEKRIDTFDFDLEEGSVLKENLKEIRNALHVFPISTILLN